MLFTTAPFLLLFLPVTLLGFYVLGRRSQQPAAAWLLLASVFFYGYWMPAAVLLLLGSIAGNFMLGQRIVDLARLEQRALAKRWLTLGIALNLAVLAYFKYANFLVDNVNVLLGTDWHAGHIVLPIGISFYCFTQIAFLVDAFEGKVKESRAVHYGLFVTYFPHLVAGPVLHHAQMMPQFADRSVYRPVPAMLVSGLGILALGMFKKVVMADGVAPYADAVFSGADSGRLPSASEAWMATAAYSLQLYFDFSGYSDMAIGLSLMFNIKLPFNFNSPYRAQNITEFWRRWHMSLSTFLRDYLYIPLGGNRSGRLRRHINLMTTMLLGGLWHGASWSFVIWGGLHGLYLVVNHGYRALLGERLHQRLSTLMPYRAAAWALTLLAVALAWIFFRATTLDGAWRVLTSMTGLTRAAEPGLLLWNAGLSLERGLLWCLLLGGVALYAPNSNRIGEYLQARMHAASTLRPLLAGAAIGGLLLLLLVNVARDSVSAFIYFNF